MATYCNWVRILRVDHGHRRRQVTPDPNCWNIFYFNAKPLDIESKNLTQVIMARLWMHMVHPTPRSMSPQAKFFNTHSGCIIRPSCMILSGSLRHHPNPIYEEVLGGLCMPSIEVLLWLCSEDNAMACVFVCMQITEKVVYRLECNFLSKLTKWLNF